MRQYTVILFGLIFCCSNVVANGYYRALGITATQKVKKIVPHPSTLKRRGVELRAMDKENKGSSLTQEAPQGIQKCRKISQDTTLYGWRWLTRSPKDPGLA